MAKKQPVPKSAPYALADEEGNEPDERDPRPLYKLAAKAYHDDVFYNVGDKMHFEGPPAWYMTPVCAKAKALVKQHWPDGQEQPDGLAMLSSMQPGAVAATSAMLKAA